MEIQTEVPTQTRSTPPILVIAAVAVVIFSATGTAAIMGWLPQSSGKTRGEANVESNLVAAAPDSSAAAPADAASPPTGTVTEARGTSAASSVEPTKVAAASTSPACDQCGIIESVREIKQRGEGSGIGAVGGAVVGGLVGHQFGGGDGKKITTAAGAIGGALAGHQIEKEVKATRRYEVTVRLDDGSIRVIDAAGAPDWKAGDRVRLVNGEIRAL